MNVFIVVLVTTLVACVAAAEISIKLIEECQNEAQVPEEERKSAFKYSRFGPKQASTAVKCAHKCLLEKTNILENDHLNAHIILKHATQIDADLVRQIVDKCNRESGVDDCDTAFQKACCLSREIDGHNGISAI